MSEAYIINVDYHSRDDHLPVNYGPYDSQKEAEEVAVRYAAELAGAEGADGDLTVKNRSTVDGHCASIYVGLVLLMTVEKVSKKTPDISRGH